MPVYFFSTLLIVHCNKGLSIYIFYESLNINDYRNMFIATWLCKSALHVIYKDYSKGCIIKATIKNCFFSVNFHSIISYPFLTNFYTYIYTVDSL